MAGNRAAEANRKAPQGMSAPGNQPILVCMVWRGGDRFERALQSIRAGRRYFSRVILSITGPPDGADMQAALDFRSVEPTVEVLCTETELPTMQHQAYWVDYLAHTGVRSSDWIYWLSYDDELRVTGIENIVDDRANWPLVPGTAYFGPWAMRGEAPDRLWNGDPREPLPSWTSFPVEGPTRLPVESWIADQLRQPTYMQMSGSVNPFQAFLELRHGFPRKRGPMRIEMAIAASRGTREVAEFSEPLSIIYGRSDSDRASYGKAARIEDAHLAAWLVRYALSHPRASASVSKSLVGTAARSARMMVRSSTPVSEEWRVRGSVEP